jgi:chromosome partitioning protein
VANLSIGLARQGHKTLVVDMDPQADVTYAILGARPPLLAKGKPLPPTVYGLLLEKYDFGDVRLTAPRYPNLDILPSNSDLASAALQLVNDPGSQTVLLQLLRGLLLVINALAAADEVVVMTTPGKLELDAIKRMVSNVDRVRTRTLLDSDQPRVTGILLTLADHYTVTRDTKAAIEEKYPGLLLQTVIPKNDDLKKAISRAKSVFEFNPTSRGAQAYELLVKEVVNYGN